VLEELQLGVNLSWSIDYTTPLLLHEKQEESLAHGGFLRMLDQFIDLYIHAESLSTR
jgi:hypothetical protein